MKLRALALVCAATVAAAGTTAGAQTILGNLPGTPSGTGSNLGLGIDGADRTKAVGLTVGGDDWNFISMVALISNTDPGSTLSGGIYSDVGGNPGALLAAFTPVAVAPSFGPTEITLTTAAAFTLQSGTSYWFALDGPNSTNSLLWETLNPNAAPTAVAGITYDGYRFSSNGGTTWGASGLFNGVAINATVVPAPATAALLGLGGIAAVRRRR